MSDYAEFFLNSKSSVVHLETIEISHPNFTKVYRVVRNATEGITVTLETSDVVEFEYYPLMIESVGVKDDLDQGIRITLGDLGEVLPKELDEIVANSGFGIKPVVKYRVYRSDDLSRPVFGPVNLEVSNFAFTSEGATFEAAAPSININKTGEIYTLERFPMLRGVL